MTHRTIRTIIEQQEAITAPGSTTVIAAARLMKEHHVGAVMIVEDGKLAGVFTERDALFRDTIVYLTCVHELGHALGLSHTAEFEDIDIHGGAVYPLASISLFR